MMNRIVLGISLAIALGCLISPLGAKEPGSKASGAIYARPYQPPTRSAFLPPCRRAARAAGLASGLVPGSPCTPPATWMRMTKPASANGYMTRPGRPIRRGLPDMATRDPMDFFPHPMPDGCTF